MGDHRSAYLFGELFREFARDDLSKEDFALVMWKCMEELDFHWSEMRANEALEKFGLARRRIDPEYPTEGEVWFYGPMGKDQT
jgi:hypothetical protein